MCAHPRGPSEALVSLHQIYAGPVVREALIQHLGRGEEDVGRIVLNTLAVSYFILCQLKTTRDTQAWRSSLVLVTQVRSPPHSLQRGLGQLRKGQMEPPLMLRQSLLYSGWSFCLPPNGVGPKYTPIRSRGLFGWKWRNRRLLEESPATGPSATRCGESGTALSQLGRQPDA